MSALYVETTGSGPAVVLLHSSGLTGRQWHKLAARVVERGFRAVVPDLTGHGKSPALVEPTPAAYRDDVAHVLELITRLGDGEPVHLVGHSYGGLVALHAALEAPARVRTLSVYDPVAFGILDAANVEDAPALAELAALGATWSAVTDTASWLAAFVDYWSGPGAWAALREPMRAEFRRVGWAVREGVRTLMLDRTPATAYAARSRVQLLTGEHTPIAARRVIARLAAAIPNARVTVIPGAGHMGPMTHPDLVNAAIATALTVA